jgi:hypothetical protein
MNENLQYPARFLSPEQMVQDINQFASLYKRVHPFPLAEFPVRDPGEELSSLKGRLLTPLSIIDFYKILAPIINNTGDEHTHLMLPAHALLAYARNGGIFFPFDLKILDEHAYIASTLDGKDHGIPPGAELISINGHPMTEIIPCLRDFFSGTSIRQKEFFLENSFPEAMYLGYGLEERFTLVYTTSNDLPPSTITVEGRPIVEAQHDTDFPVMNETPLRYRNDNQFKRIGAKTLLLEFRSFENKSGKLTRLIEEMFEVASNERRDALIIDLRRNIGGNSFAANGLLAHLAKEQYELLDSSELRASAELKQHFLKFMPPILRMLGVHYIHPWTRKLWQVKEGEQVSISFKPYRPKKGISRCFDGQVIVLSGPGDYSSSAIMLGTLKHYGMAKIVGEPSGGYPTHYGNCIKRQLENSLLEVLVPASINHGKGHGPVFPDEEARISRTDIAAGRDAVLEYALKQVE